MKTDVQSCQRRNGCSLTIAPGYAVRKMTLCAEGTSFCKNRMQKDDLPDPLGSLIMQVNGALNFRSSVIRRKVCPPANVTAI